MIKEGLKGIAKIIVRTVRTIVKYSSLFEDFSSLVEDSASVLVESLISRIASLSGEAVELDIPIIFKQIITHLNFYI